MTNKAFAKKKKIEYRTKQFGITTIQYSKKQKNY